MSEPVAKRPRQTPLRLALGAFVVVALAIAISIYVGNAGSVPKPVPCDPQSAAAKAVDAAAVGQLAALNGTGTGRGYADATLTDLSGKTVKLSDFAGKYLLVNFWASWCGPCKAEMPELDRLAAKFDGPDFMVLPVNTGDPDAAKGKAFLAASGWTNLPYYADRDWATFKQLQTSAVASGLPTTLLLDKKGCEIGVLQGPAVWDSPDGANVIKALKSA